MKQKQIANLAKVTAAALSQYLNGKRTPLYKTAVRLGQVTETDPIIWLEQDKTKMRVAIARMKAKD